MVQQYFFTHRRHRFINPIKLSQSSHAAQPTLLGRLEKGLINHISQRVEPNPPYINGIATCKFQTHYHIEGLEESKKKGLSCSGD